MAHCSIEAKQLHGKAIATYTWMIISHLNKTETNKITLLMERAF
jgi:hypothetical protein